MADEIDFEAEGLLDGLDDERAREARRALLEALSADGVGLEELRAAVAEDRLVLLRIERALGAREQRFTRAEVAERAGLEVETLQRLWRAMGMADVGPDERIFGEEDVEHATLTARVLETGMPIEAILEITRVMGEAMSRSAFTVGELFAESFMRAGDTELEAAERYAQHAGLLKPLLQPLMQYVYDLHQREQLRQGYISRAELDAGRLEGARDVTVCFADLVGFTRLGESVEAEELGDVAGRLAALAADTASGPVRLVKMIGDAAMLVSPEPEPLVDAALDMVAAAEDDERLPSLRAGVATGRALARAGDWYGRPVNLASRICSYARPASVLATDELHDALGDGYRWSRVGPRRFKGIKGSVALWRVRPPEADG